MFYATKSYRTRILFFCLLILQSQAITYGAASAYTPEDTDTQTCILTCTDDNTIKADPALYAHSHTLKKLNSELDASDRHTFFATPEEDDSLFQLRVPFTTQTIHDLTRIIVDIASQDTIKTKDAISLWVPDSLKELPIEQLVTLTNAADFFELDSLRRFIMECTDRIPTIYPEEHTWKVLDRLNEAILEECLVVQHYRAPELKSSGGYLHDRPANTITNVTISPNGAYITILDNADRLQIRWADNCAMFWFPDVPYETALFIKKITWHPASTHLLINSNKGLAQLISLQRLESIRQHINSTPDTYGETVAFAPNGGSYALADVSQIQIWCMNHETCFMLTDPTAQDEELFVTNILFSPNSTKIAAVFGNSRAAIFDITTRTLLGLIDGAVPVLEQLKMAFSPDSTQIIITGTTDGAIQAVHISTGTLLHKYPGHKTHVVALAFNHHGTKLMTIDRTGIGILYDTSTQKIIWRHNTYQTYANSCTWHESDSAIVCEGRNCTLICDDQRGLVIGKALKAFTCKPLLRRPGTNLFVNINRDRTGIEFVEFTPPVPTDTDTPISGPHQIIQAPTTTSGSQDPHRPGTPADS